jgi:hypothetical protein
MRPLSAPIDGRNCDFDAGDVAIVFSRAAA